MASNVQKTPFARSLNDFAATRAQNRVQRVGKTLPCSVVSVTGSIVKVKFEITDPTITLPQATMPVFGPEYIRYPIQPGCKGMAVAADAFIGAMSGLGTGIATLAEQPNLSALVFLPVGNTGFSSVDGNKLVLYGHDGTTILNKAGGAASIAMTETSITLSCGGHTIVISASGVVIDSKPFLTHEHSGITVGAGNSGGVV